MAALHLFLILISVVSILCGPISPKVDPYGVIVTTVNGTEACLVGGKHFFNGEYLPNIDPCEYCQCKPPGYSCQTVTCKTKPSCQKLERIGLCCPEYVCDCKYKDKIYNNGDLIRDESQPCMQCFCETGEIKCSAIICKPKPGKHCKEAQIPGKCCKEYACPIIEPVKPKPQNAQQDELVPLAESPLSDQSSELETNEDQALTDDPTSGGSKITDIVSKTEAEQPSPQKDDNYDLKPNQLQVIDKEDPDSEVSFQDDVPHDQIAIVGPDNKQTGIEQADVEPDEVPPSVQVTLNEIASEVVREGQPPLIQEEPTTVYEELIPPRNNEEILINDDKLSLDDTDYSSMISDQISADESTDSPAVFIKHVPILANPDVADHALVGIEEPVQELHVKTNEESPIDNIESAKENIELDTIDVVRQSEITTTFPLRQEDVEDKELSSLQTLLNDNKPFNSVFEDVTNPTILRSDMGEMVKADQEILFENVIQREVGPPSSGSAKTKGVTNVAQVDAESDLEKAMNEDSFNLNTDAKTVIKSEPAEKKQLPHKGSVNKGQPLVDHTSMTELSGIFKEDPTELPILRSDIEQIVGDDVKMDKMAEVEQTTTYLLLNDANEIKISPNDDVGSKLYINSLKDYYEARNDVESTTNKPLLRSDFNDLSDVTPQTDLLQDLNDIPSKPILRQDMAALMEELEIENALLNQEDVRIESAILPNLENEVKGGDGSIQPLQSLIENDEIDALMDGLMATTAAPFEKPVFLRSSLHDLLENTDTKEENTKTDVTSVIRNEMEPLQPFILSDFSTLENFEIDENIIADDTTQANLIRSDLGPSAFQIIENDEVTTVVNLLKDDVPDQFDDINSLANIVRALEITTTSNFRNEPGIEETEPTTQISILSNDAIEHKPVAKTSEPIDHSDADKAIQQPQPGLSIHAIRDVPTNVEQRSPSIDENMNQETLKINTEVIDKSESIAATSNSNAENVVPNEQEPKIIDKMTIILDTTQPETLILIAKEDQQMKIKPTARESIKSDIDSTNEKNNDRSAGEIQIKQKEIQSSPGKTLRARIPPPRIQHLPTRISILNPSKFDPSVIRSSVRSDLQHVDTAIDMQFAHIARKYGLRPLTRKIHGKDSTKRKKLSQMRKGRYVRP